jgi:tetratricopeptide (TPR) repeat protein
MDVRDANDMADIADSEKPDRRLSSWKEIAQFFGKDERTVKRWEQRGLPVRRVPRGTRSSVFAYESELEGWLRGAPPTATAVEPVAATPTALAEALPPPPAPRTSPLYAAAIIIAAMLGASTIAYVSTQAPASVPPVESTAHIAPGDAQALYRQGVADWNTRTADGFDKAITAFEAALKIDPDYAAAYAGLANVYNLLSQYTAMPAADAYGKAAEMADKALALDPNLAEAYAAKGFTLFYGAHEFARSAEMFEESIKRNPDAGQALHWYALTSMHMGQFDKPLELIGRAAVALPDSRSVRANMALITFYAGRPADAIAMLRSLKQAEPDYLATPSYLATIYLAEGRYPEFLGEYEEAANVAESDAQLRIAAAARRGLADGGSSGMLSAMLEAQKREFAAGAEPAYKLAVTAALMSDDAEALSYLEQSVAKGEPDSLSLRIETAFHRLHGNATYSALLERVGLPLP